MFGTSQTYYFLFLSFGLSYILIFSILAFSNRIPRLPSLDAARHTTGAPYRLTEWLGDRFPCLGSSTKMELQAQKWTVRENTWIWTCVCSLLSVQPAHTYWFHSVCQALCLTPGGQLCLRQNMCASDPNSFKGVIILEILSYNVPPLVSVIKSRQLM